MVKLLSSICAISTLSSCVSLYATSCSKNATTIINITKGDNCVWASNRKTLTVTNVSSAANAVISLEKTNDISFNLDQTTDGIDIVTGLDENVKNILSISASFTTDRAGKEITIKQIDGNASITITVIADSEGLLSLNTSAMKSNEAMIVNQCSYVEPNNVVLVKKDATFGTEENPNYVSVPLSLSSPMQQISPEVDLIALSNDKQISDISFSWTDPYNNDFKSITMKLNDKVYKSLNIWKASSITVKTVDSFKKAEITPLSINIMKDHYVIESGTPCDAEGTDDGMRGIYIKPSQNDESPSYGLWNGVYQEDYTSYLKIAIPSEILSKMGEITSWKGQIGIENPKELEIVNKGVDPLDKSIPYITLPGESLNTNYVYLCIDHWEVTKLPDRIVYITVEDNLGHSAAINFKIVHISTAAYMWCEHQHPSYIQGVRDGRVWTSRELWTYFKDSPYASQPDDYGELRFERFNGDVKIGKAAKYKAYAYMGNDIYELKLYDVSGSTTETAFRFDAIKDTLIKYIEFHDVSGNTIRLLYDTQFFVYGYDENNNVISRFSFKIEYIYD